MSRRKAWFLAVIVTVSVVSLVLGVGASLGYFGFSHADRASASAGATTELRSMDDTSSVSQRYYDDDDDREEHEGERSSHKGEREHRSGEYRQRENGEARGFDD